MPRTASAVERWGKARDIQSGNAGKQHPPRSGRNRASRHRAPSRSTVQVVLASVAAGAILAGGTSTAHAGSGKNHGHNRIVDGDDDVASADNGGGAALLLEMPAAPRMAEWADQLARARDRLIKQAEREAEARRPRTLAPVSGTLTSSFGPRWGTNHNGLDIANAIGTPIVAVTDGTVLEAGPAQGFGLWIRVQQDDGTIGVYGHMNEIFVGAGQRVRAGETIATVGNRGQSTGPHLHYEVWNPDGGQSDPLAWLRARGVDM
ncbi:peptidase [Nocardia cyriacigeorgica]|nr:peptidase [Nocardia cyriacigeorgica]